ncbi:MAG TPA: bifunctional adenosylcobinamide kinase/adenosylcobinamide-phosphate guanylyltransferase [Kiloniellales bacterium]
MGAAPALRLPAPVTLVLGGARSGKSRYGERLAETQPGRPLYVATAQAGDAEMAARIAAHRARRGRRWDTVEEPLELVAVLRAPRSGESTDEEGAVLVDCLTLWLSNLLHARRDPAAETDALLAVLPALTRPVVFISNEVGLGVVPDNALARAFVDRAGRMHQRLADAAQSVVFMAAGQAMLLKSPR